MHVYAYARDEKEREGEVNWVHLLVHMYTVNRKLSMSGQAGDLANVLRIGSD